MMPREPQLSAPPCSRCGYNGPGYYQPHIHACAGIVHLERIARATHHPDAWTRDRLDRHIVQRIREAVQISTMIEREHDEDGYPHHVLRDGGDERIWAVVQAALADGGWIICPRAGNDPT